MSLAKFPIPLQDQLSVTSISQRTTFVTKTNVMGSMQSMYTFFIFVESLIQFKHEWNIKHESLPFVTFYILNWQCFEAYVMHFIARL